VSTQETFGDPLPTRNMVGGGALLSQRLRRAALEGRVEELRRLVRRGADVHFQDQRGCTTLHAAVVHGHVEAVRVLVELGADVHTKDQDGATPLHVAAHQGHVEAVRVLVELGADVHTLDNMGRSALKCASLSSHVDVVRLLAGHAAASSTRNNLSAHHPSQDTTTSPAADAEVQDQPHDPEQRGRVPRVCEMCDATRSDSGGKPRKCEGCQAVRYCSTACQKRHWRRQHRDECSGMRSEAAAVVEPATAAQ
jgi:hypothetical protein